MLLGAVAAAPASAGEAQEPAALRAAAFKVLHTFRSGSDGFQPGGGLAADAAGNLYGTTYYHGAAEFVGGTVFMLKPPAAGQTAWTYRVIYRFPQNANDAIGPTGALTVRNGIIYGATAGGGNQSCGCGTVFRLRPLNAAKTLWKYAVIHRFNERRTGSTPGAGVVFGPDGALYGSTTSGGTYGAGTVFRLVGSGDGPWSKTTIYQFRGPNTNSGPAGELIFNKAGNVIYGTTFSGGSLRQGTVFQLKRAGASWTHTVLKAFRPSYTTPHDGALPRGQLIFGKDGALYGTTEAGDRGGSHTYDLGTVFRLKPNANGTWTFSVVHEFRDANGPKAGLTMDSAGNFYGTASGGGFYGAGVIYKLTQLAGGKWGFTTLHNFDHANGGNSPWDRPIFSGGALFGTTLRGGPLTCSTGCGLVYRFTR